jgi:hypothetical protein
MANDLLDQKGIHAAAQGIGHEGVAQRMGMDMSGLETRTCARDFEDLSDATGGKWCETAMSGLSKAYKHRRLIGVRPAGLQVTLQAAA